MPSEGGPSWRPARFETVRRPDPCSCISRSNESRGSAVEIHYPLTNAAMVQVPADVFSAW